MADLNQDRAAETVALVEALGVQAIAVRCDVGDEADIHRLRQSVVDRFGRVDLLMNNAGVLPIGSLEATPLAAWERVLRINLLSAVAGVQAFLPDLTAAREAHIVNTASFAGLISYDPFSLAYSASKAAVVNFSEGLAVYLRPRNIGVTCLCPGAVITNIGEQISLNGERPASLGVFATTLTDRRTSDEVGAQVVAAIRQGRFLLPTDETILDLVRERAANPEAFVDKIVSTIGG